MLWPLIKFKVTSWCSEDLLERASRFIGDIQQRRHATGALTVMKPSSSVQWPSSTELDCLLQWACPSDHTSPALDEACATVTRMGRGLLCTEGAAAAIMQTLSTPGIRSAFRQHSRLYKGCSARCAERSHTSTADKRTGRAPLPMNACPICLSEHLNDPVQLGCACGKAFCGPCIQRAFADATTEVARRRLCPHCLQPARRVRGLTAVQEIGRSLGSILVQAEELKAEGGSGMEEKWHSLMNQAALLLVILAMLTGLKSTSTSSPSRHASRCRIPSTKTRSDSVVALSGPAA